MRVVSGIFNGTGAAVYVCIGFVPDWVKIMAISDANGPSLHWSKHMRVDGMCEGLYDATGNTALSDQTTDAGIRPYYGGDTLTTTNQTTVTYGEGVYLGWDRKDYRRGDDDAVSDDIDTWTLDTDGSQTGHFNEDVTGTYIGAGSRIRIGGRWYAIMALTATQGEAADEVELNDDAPSGAIDFITGKYDMAPISVGNVTPAGFLCNMTANVNANNELQWFEAGVYDR